MNETPSNQIDPGVKQALAANPDAEFSLLIRVTQVDDQAELALLSRGATIRHRITLLPTFAVTCTGAAALSLLGYSWVRRIEADQPVHTMMTSFLR
jgi:hypothetical protein